MAFACAVEPLALRVPLAQVTGGELGPADVEVPPPAAVVVEVPLLSDPHAVNASASVPTAAVASNPVRVSFT